MRNANLFKRNTTSAKLKGACAVKKNDGIEKYSIPDERMPRLNFFEHWAPQAGRTNTKFAKDRKNFISMCHHIVANELPDENE